MLECLHFFLFYLLFVKLLCWHTAQIIRDFSKAESGPYYGLHSRLPLEGISSPLFINSAASEVETRAFVYFPLTYLYFAGETD